MTDAGIDALRERAGSHEATREDLIEVIRRQAKVITRLKRALTNIGLSDVCNEIKTNQPQTNAVPCGLAQETQ
jgi:hypothetical protein